MRLSRTLVAAALFAPMLAAYTRGQNARPPAPPAELVACTGWDDCGTGPSHCRLTPPGRLSATFTVVDSGATITSDGKGAFGVDVGDNAGAVITGAAVLAVNPPTSATKSVRSFSVDLRRPVTGDIGTPLGVIVEDGSHGKALLEAQWYTEADQTQHNVTDIPIGSTVGASQLDVIFHIDGVVHALQMGPLPVFHCYRDGTSIDGRGTSQGSIYRASVNQWIIDLPTGSVGRLYDIHKTAAHALNRGLYYVGLHFILERSN